LDTQATLSKLRALRLESYSDVILWLAAGKLTDASLTRAALRVKSVPACGSGDVLHQRAGPAVGAEGEIRVRVVAGHQDIGGQTPVVQGERAAVLAFDMPAPPALPIKPEPPLPALIATLLRSVAMIPEFAIPAPPVPPVIPAAAAGAADYRASRLID
jgi:hypothetical protein